MILQFSSVVQSCLTLCNPMNRSTPGLPVHHQLPEFTQTHVVRVSDAIKPSHPLSSPSPPAPNPSQHQGLFQWVNSLHEVAKVLEFQLQHIRLSQTQKLQINRDSIFSPQENLNSPFERATETRLESKSSKQQKYYNMLRNNLSEFIFKWLFLFLSFNQKHEKQKRRRRRSYFLCVKYSESLQISLNSIS